MSSTIIKKRQENIISYNTPNIKFNNKLNKPWLKIIIKHYLKKIFAFKTKNITQQYFIILTNDTPFSCTTLVPCR